MPREESIVKPGSHCPQCQTAIAWYHNIPLLSFIALAGKCRDCKAPIPFRYFLVEIINALMWVGLWLYLGNSALLVGGLILFSILLAVSMTDLETGLIPDKLSLPGMVLGLILCAAAPSIQGESMWYRGLLQSALGLLGGGALLYATAWIGDWIFKKETMGGGDIKLIAMIGAFVGLIDVFWVFLLGPIVSMPFALYLKIFRKLENIRFEHPKLFENGVTWTELYETKKQEYLHLIASGTVELMQGVELLLQALALM